MDQPGVEPAVHFLGACIALVQAHGGIDLDHARPCLHQQLDALVPLLGGLHGCDACEGDLFTGLSFSFHG